MRVLCFGDSNTWGYIPGVGKRYESHVRWSGRLAQEPGVEVAEEGLNGRTTVFASAGEEERIGLNYIFSCVMSHVPLDYVVIMLGTNDTKIRYGASADRIAQGVQQIIAAIRAAVKSRKHHPKIIIISPAPMKILPGPNDFDEESARKIKELEPELERLAQKEQCEFMRASDYVKEVGADGVHFTPENHEALYRAVLEKIRCEV